MIDRGVIMLNLSWMKCITNDVVYAEMNSPVGELTLFVSIQGLHAVLWNNDRHDVACQKVMQNLQKTPRHPVILQTKQQLMEYFTGERKTFDIPLVMRGTDFQMQAWQQLSKIPYGETLSYGEQARKIGNKNKARAVGLANGLNPISIIIPCHRVIGSNGKLVGFGGGLDKKAYLLKLEQKHK
jgi:methylated-DNA-[protein]-cysteine S-methyltransferase